MSGRRRRAAAAAAAAAAAEEEDEYDAGADASASASSPPRRPEGTANDADEEGGDGGAPDGDTLRVMVSTDNHLGYAERDPVRGLDSFAAFEEVLALAKRHKCDMVLLAGDLFHDNKPSRRTLHKTMEIMRRYCMGPDPVQFQVVSDQSANFRSPNGTVNYEDEFYSVDLPIFSIHGNHDDPTREGGTEMLAALDLLSATNLVNYFGRQDEVDRVEVSPVLMRKGETKVAVYGMGSMRDERLNRMWRGKKVRFLRPDDGSGGGGDDDDDDDDDDDEEEGAGKGWFNIFALHQNRDLGRGTKNCVHESMIPEWMDLVVWGHEHECLINPMESVVGLYRITQPGSSVATSLTSGESERKHVGILDVRGQSFRLRPVPLSQVRPFAVGEISLKDEKESLDPEDPNVDDAMADLLADHVEGLVREARERGRILREDAEEAALASAGSRPFETEVGADGSVLARGQKYRLEKPDQVLVRLRVEHSGFGTLNNQRFGSRFVSEVANPADILLFHRKRSTETVKRDGSKSASKRGSNLDDPIEPEELAEVNVEDLVKENLEAADKKLEILDEGQLGVALDDFVSKEQRQAIPETISDILERQQKRLIRRSGGGGGGGGGEGEGEDGEDGPGSRITTAAAVREVCMVEADRARSRAAAEEEAGREGRRRAAAAASSSSKRKRGGGGDSSDDGGDGFGASAAAPAGRGGGDGVGGTAKRGPAKRARSRRDDDDDGSEDDDGDDFGAKRAAAPKARGRGAAASSAAKPPPNRGGGAAAAAAAAARKARARRAYRNESSDDDDDEVEVVEKAPAAPATAARGGRSGAGARPGRRAAASSAKKGRYNDGSDLDEDGDDDFVASPPHSDDDDDLEVVEDTKPKKRGAGTAAASAGKARAARGRATPASSARKQKQPVPGVGTLSFTSARKPKATTTRGGAASSGRRRRPVMTHHDDDSDDDGGGAAGGGAGWGTASSQGSRLSRSRR